MVKLIISGENVVSLIVPLKLQQIHHKTNTIKRNYGTDTTYSMCGCQNLVKNRISKVWHTTYSIHGESMVAPKAMELDRGSQFTSI